MSARSRFHRPFKLAAPPAGPAFGALDDALAADLGGGDVAFEGMPASLPAVELDPGLSAALDSLPPASEAAYGPRRGADFSLLAAPVVAAPGTFALASGPVAFPTGDTAVYPFRAIAFLRIDIGAASYRGTAFFIAPRTLATAGHNVYFHGPGSFADRIEVWPGRNGSVALRADPLVAQDVDTVQGWVATEDPTYDYGVIFLDEPFGDTIGWFGLQDLGDAAFGSSLFELAGYPNSANTQVRGRGQVREAEPRRVFYDIPTAGGQSGSPLWRPQSAHAVAVHGYDSGNLNSGVRINAEVHGTLRGWRK
jgi:V8-like Glu-specific endopeptidase